MTNGAKKQRHVLITGGSGFIGSNLADRLLHQGERVLLYDNLSRAGVVQNYEGLRAEHGSRVSLLEADMSDAAALDSAVENAGSVFHFAAQVAVTTSLEAPLARFRRECPGDAESAGGIARAARSATAALYLHEQGLRRAGQRRASAHRRPL